MSLVIGENGDDDDNDKIENKIKIFNNVILRLINFMAYNVSFTIL